MPGAGGWRRHRPVSPAGRAHADLPC